MHSGTKSCRKNFIGYQALHNKRIMEFLCQTWKKKTFLSILTRINELENKDNHSDNLMDPQHFIELEGNLKHFKLLSLKRKQII